LCAVGGPIRRRRPSPSCWSDFARSVTCVRRQGTRSGARSPGPKPARRSRGGGQSMNRRAALRLATSLLRSLITLVLAVPALAYIVSPLRKRNRDNSFATLTRLSQLEAGVPRSFAIIEDRHDAWVKYPREPVGAVWLVRQKAGATPSVIAFSA